MSFKTESRAACVTDALRTMREHDPSHVEARAGAQQRHARWANGDPMSRREPAAAAGTGSTPRTTRRTPRSVRREGLRSRFTFVLGGSAPDFRIATQTSPLPLTND